MHVYLTATWGDIAFVHESPNEVEVKGLHVIRRDPPQYVEVLLHHRSPNSVTRFQ